MTLSCTVLPLKPGHIQRQRRRKAAVEAAALAAPLVAPDASSLPDAEPEGAGLEELVPEAPGEGLGAPGGAGGAGVVSHGKAEPQVPRALMLSSPPAFNLLGFSALHCPVARSQPPGPPQPMVESLRGGETRLHNGCPSFAGATHGAALTVVSEDAV